MVELDDFFAGRELCREIFDAVMRAVKVLGPSEIKVSKSQVAIKRRKIFVRVWIPGQYLRGKTAPLVLTFSFKSRDPSPRWKEIVEAVPGRFTHHLELYSTNDVDDQVQALLQASYNADGE